MNSVKIYISSLLKHCCLKQSVQSLFHVFYSDIKEIAFEHFLDEVRLCELHLFLTF